MEVKQTNKKFWKHKLLVKTGHDTRFWRVSKIMGEPVNNISTRCQKQFNDKNVWLFKKKILKTHIGIGYTFILTKWHS